MQLFASEDIRSILKSIESARPPAILHTVIGLGCLRRLALLFAVLSCAVVRFFQKQIILRRTKQTDDTVTTFSIHFTRRLDFALSECISYHEEPNKFITMILRCNYPSRVIWSFLVIDSLPGRFDL